MFIKDEIRAAYTESYWGSVSWDTWGATYLMWSELLEVGSDLLEVW